MEEEGEGEGEEHYGAIQATLDLLQSPLFSALVDIRNQYQQVGHTYPELFSPAPMPPKLTVHAGYPILLCCSGQMTFEEGWSVVMYSHVIKILATVSLQIVQLATNS